MIKGKKLAILVPHPTGGFFESTVEGYRELLQAFSPELTDKEVDGKIDEALGAHKEKLESYGMPMEVIQDNIETLLALEKGYTRDKCADIISSKGLKVEEEEIVGEPDGN